MPTRNVVLTDHQAELIEQLVELGRYQNASEVLRDGLRLIERRDREDEVKLKALRSAVNIGLADMEAGRYTAFETPDALRKHVTALMKRGRARRSK